MYSVYIYIDISCQLMSVGELEWCRKYEANMYLNLWFSMQLVSVSITDKHNSSQFLLEAGRIPLTCDKTKQLSVAGQACSCGYSFGSCHVLATNGHCFTHAWKGYHEFPMGYKGIPHTLPDKHLHSTHESSIMFLLFWRRCAGLSALGRKRADGSARWV